MPPWMTSVAAVDGGLQPAGRAQAATPASILLVDDDPLVARAYERMLKAAGHTVRVSNDAREAVVLFKRYGFDVIISDVSMPAMNGLEMLRVLREHDLDVPVIFMTGSPDVPSASAAIEHGALRYLIKPVPAEELHTAVSRACSLHQMARVRRQALEEFRSQGQQLGDRAGLEAGFARAVSGLWMAYQPIVSWSGRSVYAYEALVRTEEPTLRNPSHFFDAAERLQRVLELGRIIRRNVAETIPRIPASALVFVNVHPADLQDPDLVDPSAPLSAFASRVVLEITERAALDQIPDLMGRIARLRAIGYRIAVDDLGAGYAGLASFAQLEPEVVKVDMSIIRDIDRSDTKQKLVASIVALCRDLNIQLIAEGIETAAERDAVASLGGDLCQGYLFARPGKPLPLPTF